MNQVLYRSLFVLLVFFHIGNRADAEDTTERELSNLLNTLEETVDEMEEESMADPDEEEQQEGSFTSSSPQNTYQQKTKRQSPEKPIETEDLGKYPMGHGASQKEAIKIQKEAIEIQAIKLIKDNFNDSPSRQEQSPKYNPNQDMLTNTFIFSTYLAREKCNVAYEDIGAALIKVNGNPRKYKADLFTELLGIQKQIKETRDDFTLIALKEFLGPVDSKEEMKKIQDSYGHLDLMSKNCGYKAREAIYNNDIILSSYPHREKLSLTEKVGRKFRKLPEGQLTVGEEAGAYGGVAEFDKSMGNAPKHQRNIVQRAVRKVGKRIAPSRYQTPETLEPVVTESESAQQEEIFEPGGYHKGEEGYGPSRDQISTPTRPVESVVTEGGRAQQENLPQSQQMMQADQQFSAERPASNQPQQGRRAPSQPYQQQYSNQPPQGTRANPQFVSSRGPAPYPTQQEGYQQAQFQNPRQQGGYPEAQQQLSTQQGSQQPQYSGNQPYQQQGRYPQTQQQQSSQQGSQQPQYQGNQPYQQQGGYPQTQQQQSSQAYQQPVQGSQAQQETRNRNIVQRGFHKVGKRFTSRKESIRESLARKKAERTARKAKKQEPGYGVEIKRDY